MKFASLNLLNKVSKWGAAIGLASVIGLSGTSTANAGNIGIDLYLGNGTGIYFSGHKKHRYNNHYQYNDHYRPRFRDHYNHKPRRVCGPRRAVKKAYRLGLDDPRIHRVKERRIVVAGWQYGYRTKMVFKRYSNCKLIKTVQFSRY